MSTYLVRHGESQWDMEGRYKGQADVVLSTKGEAQVRTLAKFCKELPIKKIFTSPVKRCYQTALVVGQALGLTPIEIAGFAEMEISHLWQGKKVSELPWTIDQGFKHKIDPFFAFPEGESLAQVIKRVTQAYDELPTHNKILIVGHQVTLQIIILQALFGVILNKQTFTHLNQLWIDYCGLSLLEDRNGLLRLAFLNDTHFTKRK